MKRPVLIATLGLIIGIIGGLYVMIVPFIFMVFIIMISIKKNLIQNKLARRIKRWITRSGMLVFSTFFIIGAVYTKYLELDYEKIQTNLDNVKIKGTIISNKEEKSYYCSYLIRVEEINGKKQKNRKFILNISKTEKENIQYGNYISFEGNYRRPSFQRNYHGFNQKSYFKTLGIYGTFKPKGKIEILKKRHLSFYLQGMNYIRNKIIMQVNRTLKEKSRELFLGMLLGEKQQLSEEVKETFSDSGLSHLLAISGTHITYIILAIQIILQWLPISKKEKDILISITLLFYLILINFSISATRAVLMGMMAFLSTSLHRKNDIPTTISLSCLLILFCNPYQLFSLGFLLSFIGTIGVITFFNTNTRFVKKKEKRIILKINNMIKSTIAAQIIIFPMTLYYFHTFSFLFLFSNIIIGILIGPIILIGVWLLVICLITPPLFSRYNTILSLFTNTFISYHKSDF